MISETAIRLLTVDDAEEYRRIRLATLLAEPDYFGSLYEDEVSRSLDAFIAILGANRVFGADGDRMLVGVARLHGHLAVKERHKASLHGVFVQPEWRGQGLGSRLLRTVIEAARAEYERLVLSVAAENLAAISLYKRLGFEPFGIEPNARKYGGRSSDIVSMGLTLRGG